MSTLKRLLKLKRIYLLLLTPLAYIMLLIARRNAWFAEYIFARGIFKIYSELLSFITGLLPFSLAEIGILSGFVLIPALLIWRLVVIIKRKGDRLFTGLSDLLSLLGIASIVGFMLIWGCSINYCRYDFADLAGLKVRESTAEELKALCEELVAKTNAVRAELTNENEEQCFVLSESFSELGKKCKAAYKELAKSYPVVGGIYPAPKNVINSRFMSMTEFTGMFVPFTMEANVNIDVPHYSIPATMCHELAHLRGFIREDEANYIAYLACLASGDKELCYSALMDALIYSGNALAGKDIEAYVAIRSACSEAVNRDLAANSKYWEQFDDTVISNTADNLNDAYLKENGEEDGVQSYGRMVDLLLADYRKEHGLD